MMLPNYSCLLADKSAEFKNVRRFYAQRLCLVKSISLICTGKQQKTVLFDLLIAPSADRKRAQGHFPALRQGLAALLERELFGGTCKRWPAARPAKRAQTGRVKTSQL